MATAMADDRQGKTGSVQRLWGKLQEPEKSKLASAEKRYGITWREMHSYKDKMIFPQLPTCMAVEELSPHISLCEEQFRGMDRCIEQGKTYESPTQPYARMQICKSHWIKFNRCVRRRDELIMRSVNRWEHGYFESLDGLSKKEYQEDLDTKMRYFLYAASNTPDTMKKDRLELNAQHCAVRQASILNPRAAFEPETDPRAAGVV